MNLEIKHENGILFLKPLERSIEAGNSKLFKGKVRDLINEGSKIILLNLSQVEFIDSSGLGSLISIVKLIENMQGALVLCNTQDQVNKIFKLTGVDRVFQIFSDENEALTSLETRNLNGK